MMSEWNGKHVVILGAARQGLALAHFLVQHGAQVTVTDQKDENDLIQVMKDFQGSGIEWVLGGHPLDLLDSADSVALSGGVSLEIPFVQEAQQRQIPLTNDSQIFLELAPCPVIGITGSAGKTTTTLLVGEMVAAAYGQDRTWVGGNIGNPLISDVDQMREDHLAVVELSSFQLDIMDHSPSIACVLNITPNHLDRHGTMDAYTRAKAHILDYQSKTGTAVLNRDDPGSWALSDRVQGSLITFGREKPGNGEKGSYLDREWIKFWDGVKTQELVPLSTIHLLGEHNQLNTLAACAIASAAGLPIDAIRQGAATLTGVDHRLEFIRSWGGANWFNDSIATAPERSIAAIKSFQEPLVLLAGGRDKDLPWDEFARLVLDRVRVVICFGEAADLVEGALQAALKQGQGMPPLRKCRRLQEAVRVAAEMIEAGDVVLLSPGGTSFDEFIDFAERGEMFRKWVHELS
jgi:UDP-N-acetylmuramoylalanine--D-glutamate ligase